MQLLKYIALCLFISTPFCASNFMAINVGDIFQSSTAPDVRLQCIHERTFSVLAGKDIAFSAGCSAQNTALTHLLTSIGFKLDVQLKAPGSSERWFMFKLSREKFQAMYEQLTQLAPANTK